MCGGSSKARDQKTNDPVKQVVSNDGNRRSTPPRYTPEPKKATMLTEGY